MIWYEKKYYKHYKNIKLGRTIWVLYFFCFSVDLTTNDHDITY